MNTNDNSSAPCQLELENEKLRQAILFADSCSHCYEGVGLLHWIQCCGEENSDSAKVIAAILANTPPSAH
jgi:hypothetical protein